jgi:hypothetical protein
MQVNWLPSASTSALHTAEACFRFPTRITDPEVLGAFHGYSKRLGDWISVIVPQDTERFWDDLIGLGASIASNHELATVVLRKRVGATFAEPQTHQLCGFITDIEAAFSQTFPKYMEQLSLRMRPLQEQWLGFGNGMMAHLGRVTEKQLLVEECRVVGVQPVLGGYGKSHLDQNLVRIEAVLTNPMAELPEVVRLAWLISQLQMDLPRYQDALGAKLSRRLAPIAMLAPSLAAAEVLELGRCDEATTALAIEQWQIPLPNDWDLHTQFAPALMDWWETYLQTRPPWSTAMRALAKMLEAV